MPDAGDEFSGVVHHIVVAQHRIDSQRRARFFQKAAQVSNVGGVEGPHVEGGRAGDAVQRPLQRLARIAQVRQPLRPDGALIVIGAATSSFWIVPTPSPSPAPRRSGPTRSPSDPSA